MLIIKRTWESRKGVQGLLTFKSEYTYVGYFLFGIIPIYINRIDNF